MHKQLLYSVLVTSFVHLNLYSQPIPNTFLEYKLMRYNFYIDQKWSDNSTFGYRRFEHKHSESDSLKISSRFGIFFTNNQKMLYGFGHFTYKENFHGYLHPRIVDDPEKFSGYSGIPRDIERYGFSSGETDISGIAYENNWMILQYGRGRQSWGAGDDIQLALSEQSNSYDYGMLDLDFEKLRVRYFHGYLESDSLYINRYITGRGIEWNNNTNFLIGLSEIVIYSGINRPIDFSYLNPITTHLEVELNDRQNSQGTDNGNGVWQLSLDYLFKGNLRLSLNYLFDEFILDNEQKRNGKGSARAHSFKLVYLLPKNDNSYIIYHFSTISVGTNTFRHEKGYNNFVQRNSPLGWQDGSDTREIKIGFNWLYKKRMITDLDIGLKSSGEKNFIESLYEPYTDYLDEPFPSGEVENISFIFSKVQYWWKPNISSHIKLEFNDSDKLGNNFNWNIGFDIYYGVNKYL